MCPFDLTIQDHAYVIVEWSIQTSSVPVEHSKRIVVIIKTKPNAINISSFQNNIHVIRVLIITSSVKYVYKPQGYMPTSSFCGWDNRKMSWWHDNSTIVTVGSKRTADESLVHFSESTSRNNRVNTTKASEAPQKTKKCKNISDSSNIERWGDTWTRI